MAKRSRSQIAVPTDEDLARVSAVQRTIGGANVVWGARETLEIWLIEKRLEAEHLASARILAATWVLAAATLGLVAATIGLIVAAN